MILQDDDILHYGVKGMKWGVRRSDRGSGGRKSGSSKRSSEDLSKFSDEELRAMINRMQMEQQYQNLMKARNANSVTKGKDFTSQVMSQVAKQTLVNLGMSYSAKAVKLLLK